MPSQKRPQMHILVDECCDESAANATASPSLLYSATKKISVSTRSLSKVDLDFRVECNHCIPDIDRSIKILFQNQKEDCLLEKFSQDPCGVLKSLYVLSTLWSAMNVTFLIYHHRKWIEHLEIMEYNDLIQLICMIVISTIMFCFLFSKKIVLICWKFHDFLPCLAIAAFYFNIFLAKASSYKISFHGAMIDARDKFSSQRSAHCFSLSGCNRDERTNIFSIPVTDLCYFILLTFLPLILHFSPKTFLIVFVINSLVFNLVYMYSGIHAGLLALLVLLQLAFVLCAKNACKNSHVAWEKQQAAERMVLFVSDENERLLHAIIPRNVMSRLGTFDGQDMLGTTIPRATIMFCAVDGLSDLLKDLSGPDFAVLNSMITAFDQAVNQMGLFKYQHVSSWYIVACPRAERPFDASEQAASYPIDYTARMLRLAFRLRAVASQHVFSDGRAHSLSVGISTGPVAGAVLGAHRCFYTLYGDTVNAAARMCQHAAMGIQVTADVVAAADCLPWLRAESRGVWEVKGMGPMETFEIFMREVPISPLAASPARAVATFASLGLHSGNHANRSPKPSLRTSLRSSLDDREGCCMSSETHHMPSMSGCDENRGGEVGANGEFTDVALEQRFTQAELGCQRCALGLGLAVQAAVLSLQLAYEALGAATGTSLAHNGALAEAVQGLAWHSTLTACWAGAILLLAARNLFGISTGICSRGYLAMSLVHLGACLFQLALTGDAAPANFAARTSLLGGWLGALGLRCTLVLNAASLFVGAVATFAESRPLCFPEFFADLVLLAGSVCFARQRAHHRRVRWRAVDLRSKALRQARTKLFDLLPVESACCVLLRGAASPSRTGLAGSECIKDSPSLSCSLSQDCFERCRAVVLQLDLCGFARLSRSMEPLELAKLMHVLFCDFDRAVVAAGLIKIDTVGDAYIAAGFLSRSDGAESAGTAAEEGRMCAAALKAARAMLDATRKCSRKQGKKMSCRIGISVGEVVAGVLGLLQPRFHIFGRGLRAAERHEQSGRPDAVHVSAAFMESLQRGGHGLPSVRPVPTCHSASCESGSGSESGSGTGDEESLPPSSGDLSESRSNILSIGRTPSWWTVECGGLEEDGADALPSAPASFGSHSSFAPGGSGSSGSGSMTGGESFSDGNSSDKCSFEDRALGEDQDRSHSEGGCSSAEDKGMLRRRHSFVLIAESGEGEGGS